MKARDIHALSNLLELIDLIVMSAAFVLAAIITFPHLNGVSYSDLFAMRIKLQNFVLFAGFIALWHTLFSAFGLYAPDRISRIGAMEALDIAKAGACGTIGIALITAFVHIDLVTVAWLPAFWLIVTGMSILSRVAIRAFARHCMRNDASHVVIVGTNARAVALAKRIEANPDASYHLVGFVDEHWSGDERFRETGYSVVSDFVGFRALLNEQVVDEVFICIPVKSLYEWSSRIIGQCEQQGVTVRFISDLFTPTIGRLRIERFEERMVFTLDPAGMGAAVLIKRLLDVVVSAVLLIALAPVLGVIALAVKLTSPGPVCFVQDRVGLNKRRFRLYKFRTMVQDAEKRLAELESRNEVSGPVFKMTRDPRLTALGTFLRRTSLDEFPQLLNVFKGDMSLVGPRPLPVRDYRGFTQDWHRRRFSVRPGITCLWQVCGRSAIPFDRWMELDMEYIDQWSLMLDMKILLKTIPAVLKRSGAA